MWLAQDEIGFETLKELESGPDRTVGIVAGAVVESSIESAIKNELCKDQSAYGKEVQAALFFSDGVLGSFGAKIGMAYLLGYFSPEAHRDLLNLKYIRNRFAHFSDNYSFENQSIKDRCVNFKLINSRVRGANMIPSGDTISQTKDGIWLNLLDHSELLKTPKGRFVTTAKLFCAAFNIYARTTPIPFTKPVL
jgi:DNA-binding MltR family transcriptional regulator